jgi:phage terminase large subunit
VITFPPDIFTEDELCELEELDFLASQEGATAVSWQPPLDDIAPAYLDNLNNMARVQIVYGGSSSGKSVSKAQQSIIDVLCHCRNWLICRKIGRDSRHSTFIEVNRVIEAWDLHGRFKINKTDLTITAVDTGYQILFKGLDDLEKLKSITVLKGAITDIWIEEATQTEQDDVRQLLRRQRGGDPDVPKRLHLTFNPIVNLSWIYNEYFAPLGMADGQTWYEDVDGRLTIQKTTYKDNPFLAQDEIDVLEDETDKYWYDVYTLGNWGVLGDVIFTNWETRDLSAIQYLFVNRRNGLDFGFASDPAALARTHYDKKRKTIYVFKELYQRGLTNDILGEELIPILERDDLVCDSAEPKSIKDLVNAGIRARGARKGKDSVHHGIQWLQQQTIIIDKSCINTQNEFMLYQWKKDKDGNSLRIPVDKNNHIIDALRYAYEDDMIESGGFKSSKYA